MEFFSPRRTPLYRKALAAVTLVACLQAGTNRLSAQGTTAQYGRKAVSKGPRALGLVLLTPKGKARLTPIAIMVDGKFFDAGSYKGTPVPMALDFGIVYEGFHSGVSQGLFTITQPGQLNHNWMAEGTWLPEGAKPPETSKKYETPVIQDNDAPPKLHRRDEKPSDAPAEKPASTPPSAPAPPAASTPAAPPPPKPRPEPEAIDDPNRPILRRGKPDPNARHEAMKTFNEDEFAIPYKTATHTAGGKDAKPADVQMIPAISDAGGPDARPYTFETKPQEEASYRTKMLALAVAQMGGGGKESQPPTRPASARKAAVNPAFDDVQLRIFDLSNSNEPVLVLSATTRGLASGAGVSEEPKEITLIARTDLEGELHTLFFSATDSHHLDQTPRMELIDAVDADGDGRGELLFRRTFDSGSLYAIYRVTADRLWPLFEPAP